MHKQAVYFEMGSSKMEVMRSLFQSTILAGVVIVSVLTLLPISEAQVRQSTNFQIESDSVNFAGDRTTSTNYVLESTAGEIATGRSTSPSYRLNAGYQQMQEVYIALSAVADVVMDGSIPGLTGGTAQGSTTVSVTTDSRAGYQLTIAAENEPAMQKGSDSIADYESATSNPDFAFNFEATEAVFGFSPEGVDVASRFLDDGNALCNTGSNETTNRCWDGLATTSRVIASGASANHPTGATTTVVFQVGVGGAVGQPPGLYIATTTVTALPL